MSLKIKKGIPLIDQHDKNSCMVENLVEILFLKHLKKPIEDLQNFFKT